MNEVIVNTNEIESCWEKDNLCFVKMRSGKVWLCLPYKDFTKGENDFVAFGYSKKTIDYIKSSNGLICLPISQGKRG